jgi:hypothetical protein
VHNPPPRALLSNTLSGRDQVSEPFKAAGKNYIFFVNFDLYLLLSHIHTRESKKLSSLLFFQFINTKVGIEEVLHFSI